MFEGRYPAVVEELLDHEHSEAFDNEITEEEWLQHLLDQERQRTITGLTDAETITELIAVETAIAGQYARRAQLVTQLAAHRPASADRPEGCPGAAGWENRLARKTGSGATTGSGDGTQLAAESADSNADQDGQDGQNVVPEILPVSEWLSHELQMAHPYSRHAALDLVETSLILSGRLSATLGLLAAGRIDYPRARILTDLLGTCTEEVAHTVEAMVLPRAPELTPAGLASAIRQALAQVDAAALRRRHAQARRAAEVGYYPTQDGMARLYADLPLPVAAACSDAVDRYAKTQQLDGDDRPAGQIRTEVLTDLILRPWDTSRPTVTGEVTIHLTIPTTSQPGDPTSGTGASRADNADRTGGCGGVRVGLDDDAAQAEVDGQTITAAQCRDLLAQLQGSRLFLALHGEHGHLQAVASPTQLRRAARRHHRRRRNRAANPADSETDHGPDCSDHDGDPQGPGDADGPGLRPPPMTTRYRPTRAQDRHARTRDRTCRHFGCTRKAVHADLDHHQRWPDGPTAICNLCCYCRTHHRLKHQAPGWTHHFESDATLRITTPTGITRTTRPPGPEPAWPAPAPAPAAAAAGAAAQPTPDSHPNRTPDDDPPPFRRQRRSDDSADRMA